MRNNDLPEVVDLFSGCGGLALGFKRAGFKITHGVELVQSAADTASYNLHWRFGEESQHLCGDITKLEPEIFQDKIGPNGCIVIGGPPCQAYSLAGRAKLKSLGEARINTNDKRGYLYQDFLRFALGLKARAVVMENVPESTNYGGKNIPQTVCEILEENGYEAFWTVLNSADYGVPQLRERVIVMAVDKKENLHFKMPVPSNRSIEGKVTQNQLRFKGFSEFNNFREPSQAGPNCAPWVTVGDAFSDLPVLMPNLECKYKLNKITAGISYVEDAETDYQMLMRSWYGRTMETVTGNCYRKTLRDYPIFAQMEQGDNYAEAAVIADKLFALACAARGITVVSDTEAYEKLKKEIVPPYARDSFVTKWQKLREDRPSHTLVAHLSVDTYSHIHPWEPRGISVREAARLQSLPDGFLFQCTMGEAYKQIGNAVPPLLAEGVAKQIRYAFEGGI